MQSILHHTFKKCKDNDDEVDLLDNCQSFVKDFILEK